MHRWKLLCFAVLLVLPVTARGASSNDPRKPLRFPFGLTPDTTAQQIQVVLTSKGLKLVSKSDTDFSHSMTWSMSGQLAYESFNPRKAIVVMEGQKISSLTLQAEDLSNCTDAQAVYVSALDFVRNNYIIDKHNELTQEPALDTLDCGPHFKSEDSQLQLTNKNFVISVSPTLLNGRYTVAVTYHWAGLLKSDKDKKEKDDKKQQTLQENL